MCLSYFPVTSLIAKPEISIKRIYTEVFPDDEELGRDEWIFLKITEANPGRLQNELSLMTGMDKSAVTRMIDKLEKLEFPERRHAENDRRSRRIFLCPRG